MPSWRRSAYLIPLVVAVASVLVLQMKAGQKKQAGVRIAETRVFSGRELDGLMAPRPAEGRPPAARERISIKPTKVCLRLNTFPSGAYILLDRRGRGRSPLELKGLRPGRHLLEICRPGYTMQRIPVDLVTDERLSIKLKKEPRPRLVRIVREQEQRSSEPVMRQVVAVAKPPRRPQRSSEPSVRPVPPPPLRAKKKEPSRMAGLIRDPLGAERLERSGLP